MPDVMTPEQRRRAMRANRGRTVPELRLARAVWRRRMRFLTSEGYRKVTGRNLPGRPDLVLRGSLVVVFMDGCFWHGCTSCHPDISSMSDLWKSKIEGNRVRDAAVTAALQADEWAVLRIWEHEIRTNDALDAVADSIAALHDSRRTLIYAERA